MGLLRDAVFSSLSRLGRLLERAAALPSYAAAGTVRLEELRQAIRSEWDEADANDSQAYIASGLTFWERDLYLRLVKREDDILVVGCGTGRELLALLESGYRAVGLDLSPRAITVARRTLSDRGLATQLITGAIETLPLASRFDVVIFANHCYSYVPQSRVRIDTLRKVTAALNPGGRIVVSYFVAQPPPSRLPMRLTQLVAWLSGADWRPEYGDVFRVAPHGRALGHYEHRFPAAEFEQEVRAAGLVSLFHDPNAGLAALTDLEGAGVPAT
ncbi:MAG TPA: methyltransferase domain-containing protein [Methylomirabilota bacterium]|nr:methyltransferase domain-containing protein [Methylomirabilota bacterium]